MLASLIAFHRINKRKVDQQLLQFQYLGQRIPDTFLRQEALKSMSQKTFHCYGASFYAELVSKHHQDDYLKFMISYQTLCDYLDNLVDQTDRISEANFRRLHQSLRHIFTFEETTYYAHQPHQQDGGYLTFLMKRCQSVLKKIPNYEELAPHLIKLASLYIDLQVYKHLNVTSRELKLKYWAHEFEATYPDLAWYEFSAASGSTLCIFSLIANSFSSSKNQEDVSDLVKAYFPSVQLVHIMLDYFVDRHADELEGELNFFAQYPSKNIGLVMLEHHFKQAKHHVSQLKNSSFHQMILNGLFALYLAEGMLQNEDVSLEKSVIKRMPVSTRLLYANAYFVMKQFRLRQTKRQSNVILQIKKE